MLADLTIKNLGILDRVDLSFGEGLNVLTGETGAGKSMIVQAVHLLLGARGSEEMIRTGADEAEITARFYTAAKAPWAEWLAEQGIEFEGELLLRRLVSRSGRNRCYVNGQGVTVKFLAALGRELLSLSGQHEYQAFLAPENHLNILDAFAGLQEEVAAYQAAFRQWQAGQRQLQELEAAAARGEAARELLRFQLKELEQAQPRAGEDEELAQSRERLRHAAQLYEAARGAYDELYGAKGAVLARLGGVQKSLEVIARIETAWQERLGELEGLRIQVEDLALALRDYLSTVQSDPHRLQEVEQRLDLLTRLKKKYGPELQDVLAFWERGRKELGRYENAGAEAEELGVQVRQWEARVRSLAQALSEQRRAAAPRLAQAVMAELKDLAMPKARFMVEFLDPSGGGAAEKGDAGLIFKLRGCDRVEFFLAPNPGEEAKPLARIASGGELSRLVLSLKNILAQEGGQETSIFDEVDAGIGGGVASMVGEKLQNLGRHSQIISITHWPQIACYAESHFQVAKGEEGGRTLTQVQRLTPAARREELARMLGGAQITATTLAQAEEFLAAASQGQRTGTG